MKKAIVIVSLGVVFCFTLVSLLQAGPDDPVTEGWAKGNLINKQKAAKIPIWQITQEGTGKAVIWVNATNPRFAIYDSGTPGDETDDIVLDRETRLVWERSPNMTVRTWVFACRYCYEDKELGGRKGWRLPTIEELASLVDSTNSPSLQTGHPFVNVQLFRYWSITTLAQGMGPPSGNAYIVDFATGNVSGGGIGTPKWNENYVWCVRGGQGHDAY